MESSRPRSAAPAAVAAVLLAAAGALAVTAGGAVSSASATAESLPAVAWLAGWALLVWAAVLGGFVVLDLVTAVVAARRTARSGATRVTAARR